MLHNCLVLIGFKDYIKRKNSSLYQDYGFMGKYIGKLHKTRGALLKNRVLEKPKGALVQSNPLVFY
jgi:hypothetical protein